MKTYFQSTGNLPAGSGSGTVRRPAQPDQRARPGDVSRRHMLPRGAQVLDLYRRAAVDRHLQRLR